MDKKQERRRCGESVMRVRREDNAISRGKYGLSSSCTSTSLSGTGSSGLKSRPSPLNDIGTNEKVRWQGRSDLEMLRLLKLTCDGVKSVWRFGTKTNKCKTKKQARVVLGVRYDEIPVVQNARRRNKVQMHIIVLQRIPCANNCMYARVS